MGSGITPQAQNHMLWIRCTPEPYCTVGEVMLTQCSPSAESKRLSPLRDGNCAVDPRLLSSKKFGALN